MRAKYIKEIYNLTTNRPSNRAMKVEDLRAAIADIFSMDMKESLIAAELKEKKRNTEIESMIAAEQKENKRDAEIEI